MGWFFQMKRALSKKSVSNHYLFFAMFNQDIETLLTAITVFRFDNLLSYFF